MDFSVFVKNLSPESSLYHRLFRLLPKFGRNIGIVPDLFHIVIVFEISKESIEFEYFFRIVHAHDIRGTVFKSIILGSKSLSFEEFHHPHQIRSLRRDSHFFIVIQEFVIARSGFYDPFFDLIHRMGTDKSFDISLVLESKRRD